MYTDYFGLKEKPFSIAPDPQYLFMSDRHREALAHLTYGLGDAGGFVLLTGEVGTGKTTVSRCLMDRLPENTQAAFILNPTLSSQELLATICDELKIRYRKTGATLKTLTDKIQEKLLKNHKNHTNTLLIIDEAQHLKPEVLEQLRLLTNLETNTKKLLQVILIGQPELQTVLKRRDLRQLAQRITARYHLLPLNKQEVAQYIKHRLSIAEGIRPLFSISAMNLIYNICDGTPRLINLVCERSLINAYNSHIAVVNKKIVLLSAKEALGDDHLITSWWQNKFFKMGAMVFLFSTISLGAYFVGMNHKILPQLKDDVLVTDNKALKQGEITSDGLKSETNSTNKIDANIVKNNELDIQENITPTKKIEVTESIKPNSTNTHIAPEQAPVEALSPSNEVKLTNQESKNSTNETSNKNIEFTQVEGVSDELLEQFKEALKTKDTTSTDDFITDLDRRSRSVESIEQMPVWVQNGVPALQFEQHIYASDGKGWVKVNGRDRYEGDTIARELTLVEILPQKVVLNFRGEKFTMLALSSW